MEVIKIGNKFIDDKSSCFIIAEAGVNHNGNLNLAKKLVDLAKDAGVDAIKFQTFKTEELVVESRFSMLKKLELSEQDFLELDKYCIKKGIIFLSTPHTNSAVDFLESIVPIYKISSGDLNNLPFLRKIATKKKPIILSTGMADLEEVRKAIKIIKKVGNNKIILLHCTTSYPCPIGEVNLRAMSALKKEFSLPVGYSDHTNSIFVPIMAVAMGAVVLEKHFTLNKNLSGPDHKASLNPKELKDMVTAIKSAEEILGNGIKKPTNSEQKIKKIARKSIIANINISKGSKITKKMLIIKRPGSGILPAEISKVIGKLATRNIKKDQLLKFDMLR